MLYKSISVTRKAVTKIYGPIKEHISSVTAFSVWQTEYPVA